MKTSMRQNGTQLTRVPGQGTSSDEALRHEEEERSAEPFAESFEAIIIRLDGTAFELLLRQVGE